MLISPLVRWKEPSTVTADCWQPTWNQFDILCVGWWGQIYIRFTRNIKRKFVRISISSLVNWIEKRREKKNNQRRWTFRYWIYESQRETNVDIETMKINEEEEEKEYDTNANVETISMKFTERLIWKYLQGIPIRWNFTFLAAKLHWILNFD